MNFKIKQFLPRTLFGRSIMILITPVLLIQIIALLVFFDRHWSKMTTRLAYGVSGEIAIILKDWQRGDTQTRADLIRDAFDHLNFDLSFQPEGAMQESEPHTLPHIWEKFVADKLEQELHSQINHPFTLTLNFYEKWILVQVQIDDGVLSIHLPQRRLFSSSGYIFLLWLFASSLLLLIVAVIFMRNQIRPIRKLAAAAELFGKGRDVVTFKPEGAREVRQAGQAFLDMRRRIKRQIERRTSTLAGVSHDLRTPLTRMKLQLAMIDQNPDTIAMQEDVVLMEKMISGYLDFVRGEDEEESIELQIKDLSSKIAKTMTTSEFTVHDQIPNGLFMNLKPVAFERCMMNIIKNAEKYADQVWIIAEKDDNRLKLIIEDNGPGIPADKREEVFKPFYREDQSRNIDSSGNVGLGLTIAMDVVHRHGGSIVLDESQYGGLKVVMRLPL